MKIGEIKKPQELLQRAKIVEEFLEQQQQGETFARQATAENYSDDEQER